MAYVIKAKPKAPKPKRLPIFTKLKDGTEIEIDRLSDSKEYEKDSDIVRSILNHEIEEGISYPQEDTLSADDFRAYFLSAEAFVARKCATGEIMGSFYIKPNYPGRCNHICNGGFLVAEPFRKLGLGKVMGKNFCYLAKDLGYRASMFNLVFVNNVPSVNLWKSLGFVQTGRVPKAGRLKNGEEVDALQFYHDFRGDITFPDEIALTTTNSVPVADTAIGSSGVATASPRKRKLSE